MYDGLLLLPCITAKKLDIHVPGTKRPTVIDKHALKLHRIDNTYLVEEEAPPAASTAPAPTLATGAPRVTADSKEGKDERERLPRQESATGAPAGTSAGGTAVEAAKRKGAKRKQQDTTSSSETANKQAKL